VVTCSCTAFAAICNGSGVQSTGSGHRSGVERALMSSLLSTESVIEDDYGGWLKAEAIE
jgi:hypothetical protein